jgi:catechol 2,3-dioxygenase-like lactoylglutathione lyase family enzyme
LFTRSPSLVVKVTDLERAVRFYTEVLGFRLRVRLGPGLCFLASEGGGIDIYLEGGCTRPAAGPEAARLGFYLETREPARAAFDRLKAAGVRVLGDAPEQVDDETLVFDFEDPDGNVLSACGGA